MKSHTRIVVIGLFALAIISTTISGVFAKVPKRIYGGTNIRPDAFRFIVTVSYSWSLKHTCGGAIISKRHILTAAHCLPATNSSSYVVRSGIHNLYDVKAIVSNVKSHFVHPNYVPHELGPMQNDIGIILLDQDLDVSGVLSAISLPTAQPDYDKFYTVAGWGATQFTSTPWILQISSGITLLHEQQCFKRGGSPQQPEKLCGFKRDATICGGDSGSPLVSGGRIVGIASSSRCIIGAPHTYVNVYHYLDWIDDVINRTSKQINLQLPPLRVPHLRHHHVTHWGPYFENAEGQWINGSQHVGLHLGATAMLDCRVAMLDKRTVMWVRKNADRPSLLTLGKEVHITDSRYSVNFQYPNNWRLTIASVQKEDRGQYVCEVNTHPPTMLVTNVTVLAPDIRVVDEASHELRDRYYKTGSGIELACIVKPAHPDSQVPHPMWKKAGDVLPDHVNVYHINGSNDELITGLHIERAKKTDSGEYTCSLGQFTSTMVHIHVLNGEKQAAVHHDQWNAARTNYDETRGSLFTVLTAIQLFLYAAYSSYSTTYLL